MSSPLPILYSDNHLLIVNKPPGLVTQGASHDEPSVHRLMCQYLKQAFNKPGNVYLGIVSRLDAVTSGIVVLARTSKAAGRLSEQFRHRLVDKHYLAIVAGNPIQPDEGWVTWKDRLEKDESLERMVVIEEGERKGRDGQDRGQEAVLHARALTVSRQRTLLQIQLESGRKHQIRVQASSRRAPIVGDWKYGGPKWHAQTIALHAYRLRFEHPTLKTNMEMNVPPPPTWHELGLYVPPSRNWNR